MSLAEMAPLLVTALLTGLLGAGHCFGMCGGIAGGLGAMSAGPKALASAWIFNGGRVLGYALIGGILAQTLGAAGHWMGIPGWSLWLRGLTVLLILALGLRFAFAWSGLATIERAGAGLWRSIQPIAMRVGRFPGPLGRLMLGLMWGLLPCGLVYTLLLTATSTGSFLPGFLIMAAFGVGTLPALLGLTLWAPALASLLREQLTRRVVGFALLLLASWSAVMLWMHATATHHH